MEGLEVKKVGIVGDESSSEAELIMALEPPPKQNQEPQASRGYRIQVTRKISRFYPSQYI